MAMGDILEGTPEDLTPQLEPPRIEEETEAFDADAMPTEAPPDAREPGDDLGRAIEALGDRLSQRLEGIRSILERESRAEAARERVIDRLHAELQEYKQDLLLKVQRPIFIDLIQLHDDIGKMIDSGMAATEDADRAASVRGILESVRLAIEDILYRQGVEPFAADGDAFDPRRQRAVSTSTTDDPSRNKTIAARLRKGFQAGDKLIRPELVTVYTYHPPATEPSG